MLGGESFEDMHPDDRERMRAHFAGMLATGNGGVAEFRFVARDGEIRHIESRASPVRGPDDIHRRSLQILVTPTATVRS